MAAIWAYARFAAKHFLSKFKRLELEGPLHLGRGSRAGTVGHGDDQDVQQEDLRPPSHAGITSSTVTTRTLRSHVYYYAPAYTRCASQAARWRGRRGGHHADGPAQVRVQVARVLGQPQVPHVDGSAGHSSRVACGGAGAHHASPCCSIHIAHQTSHIARTLAVVCRGHVDVTNREHTTQRDLALRTPEIRPEIASSNRTSHC